jgi:hypothetical protein
MKIRVIDIAQPSTFDIDPNRCIDIAVLDSLLKRCVAAVTNSLKSPASGYSSLRSAHLSWMFEALGFTYVTIRSLLTQGPNTPACVDALALARLQLEALYSVCLMVEDPSFVDIYVKSYWRDAYVRFLLEREERKSLARFNEYLNERGLPLIEELRRMSGVTDEEKATVEAEEFGTPLPPGMTEARIRLFPTPMTVIDKVTDAERKKMLMRLYPEYRRLCAFAHGSAQSWMFKNAFWERSVMKKYLTESQRQGVFEKEVLDSVLLHSSLAIIQSACEVTTLYPADVELKAVVIEAWNLLSEMNLLGRTVWEIRAKAVLGVV